MLMYTNYISLHYFNYLTFCVSYTSSVNCIGFSIVSCTISKCFIDTLSLDKKLLKGQCVGIEAIQALVNYIIIMTFLRVTQSILSLEIENFSTQNSNTHKHLPVTDRVDKAIHGPNETLVNSTRLFSHGQTDLQHVTSHITM